jgi:fused signal recognition particle receptor
LASTSILDRLKQGLAKTRQVLEMPVADVLRGQRPLDPADLQALEQALIAADLGLAATQQALQVLRDRSREIAAGGASAMRAALRDEIRKALERPVARPAFTSRPWVVFVVGVNGVGKTTTIGKLAHAWRAEGRATLLSPRTPSARPRTPSSRSGRSVPEAPSTAARQAPIRRPCSPTRCARREPVPTTRWSWTPPAGSTPRAT